MEWDKTQIYDASFKGVEFKVLSASVGRGKRHRSVGYTNRPGGLAWEGGRKPVPINMTAVFFGERWKQRAEDLIEVCDAIGAGTLVHPIYGEIWALATDYPDEVRGDSPNLIEMRLSFLEVAQGEHAWKNVIEILSPEARAGAVANYLDTALGFSSPSSFSFHVSAYLTILASTTLTVPFMHASLSAAIQSIIALAESLDEGAVPLYWDYLGDAHRIGQLLIEATDIQVGQRGKLGIYRVEREMTLVDVAAACGCTEEEIFQYNEVGDPLQIDANTLLIVPA